MFSWISTQKPIIALSPMADMSDSPFCLTAKELGAELMFREMVSSEALVRGSKKTLEMAKFDEKERPLIQQLFGGDPNTMAKAASIIEDNFHPDGFDINMGCPVYKIVSNFNGAALMKEPKRAQEIVKAMKKAVSKPVSVKIRLGWNDPHEALDFAPRLEEAGADALTIHGRTKAQGYSGKSDWEMIGRVRERVSIPVLANGDIHRPEQVAEALAITGAAGVLIARGCLGNPWFFQNARKMCEGENGTPVSLHERKRIMLLHANRHTAHYGEKSIVTFRKHLSWYLKGIPHVKEVREKMMKVLTFTDFEMLLEELSL